MVSFYSTVERKRQRTTPEERRLIDEAVAAGRVTRVPMGVGRGHPRLHEYQTFDPVTNYACKAMIAWLQAKGEGKPVTARQVMTGVWAGKLTHPDHPFTVLEAAELLDVLAKRGFLQQHGALRKGLTGGTRYTMTDECPQVDVAEVRRVALAAHENRRLALGKPAKV